MKPLDKEDIEHIDFIKKSQISYFTLFFWQDEGEAQHRWWLLVILLGSVQGSSAVSSPFHSCLELIQEDGAIDQYF